MPAQPEKQQVVETKILDLLKELNDTDPVPSAAKLAALCEVGRRLVLRVEKRLARQGLIEVVPRRGAYKRKAPPSAFEVAERKLRELARPLGPGERLPIKAGALAKRNEIGPSTVSYAVRALKEEGVLYGQFGRNGACSSDRSPPPKAIADEDRHGPEGSDVRGTALLRTRI